MLPIFQLEINDPTEAEALISQNLVCNVTGIVYKIEEFRQPILVLQCFNCQNFGKNYRSITKCLICGEGHSTKDAQIEKQKKTKSANCKGPHVASYKGCPGYKKQAFRQHVVNNQKILCRSSRPKLPPAAYNTTDIQSRTVNKIRSKRGNTNSPTTSLPKS